MPETQPTSVRITGPGDALERLRLGIMKLASDRGEGDLFARAHSGRKTGAPDIDNVRLPFETGAQNVKARADDVLAAAVVEFDGKGVTWQFVYS